VTEPSVGGGVPGFPLQDQQKQDVALADFAGAKAVLVVFYPFAFSGICTGELCAIRDDLTRFQSEQVQVLAISCDPMFTLRAWADAEGYGFPLLSDFWPHGEVARRYGVFLDEGGFATRGTFLIDRDGILRWSVVNGPGQARDLGAYQEALAALA
jgi:mycoredoxin-dependent peroxiredoxin